MASGSTAGTSLALGTSLDSSPPKGSCSLHRADRVESNFWQRTGSNDSACMFRAGLRRIMCCCMQLGMIQSLLNLWSKLATTDYQACLLLTSTVVPLDKCALHINSC